MTDIIWPADILPFGVSFYSQPYSGGTESPFTRQTKTYGLAAPRWIAKLRVRGDDGLAGVPNIGPRMDALLAQLRGRQNRIALWDFRRPIARGSAATASLTVGSTTAIGATSLPLVGAAAGSTAFKTGDYLGLAGGLLVMAVADAVADGSGHVAVVFEPPLKRDVAATEAVSTYAPSAWFKLTSDDAGDNDAEVGTPATYALDLVEDL